MWHKQHWKEERGRNSPGSKKARGLPSPAYSVQENKGIIPFQGIIKFLFLEDHYHIPNPRPDFTLPVTNHLQAQPMLAFVIFPPWQQIEGPVELMGLCCPVQLGGEEAVANQDGTRESHSATEADPKRVAEWARIVSQRVRLSEALQCIPDARDSHFWGDAWLSVWSITMSGQEVVA